MPLLRCSQEFHKWVMEKASDGNPVSVVLDRMMVREKEEPDESPELEKRFEKILEERFKKIDELEKLMGVVSEELEDFRLELEGLGRRIKKLEGEEKEGGEEGEKRGKKLPDSYSCMCGEEVDIEENTDTSWISGIEWVICPNCGERRRKENLKKLL